MNIDIILKVKPGKKVIYYKDGSHHHSVVSTTAFYGVTFYSRGLLWWFLSLCF